MEMNQLSQNKEKWYQKLNRKFIEWVKSIAKKKEVIKPENDQVNKTESLQEKEIREDKEEFRKFFETFKTQTSLNVDADKLTNAINNFQYYETRIFEQKGYDDGLKG